MFVLGLVFFLQDEIIANVEKEDENQEEKDDDQTIEEEKYKDYVVDHSLIKISNLPDLVKIYDVDVNAGNDVVKYSGYDGYYLVLDGNDYYLKRNQRLVSKLDENNLKLYKDETDKNSKYIAIYCGSFGFCNFATIVTDEYAYLSVNSSDYKKSIIFNVNTGEHKLYDDGVINPIFGVDEVIFTHESYTDYGISIVSLDDFSLKRPHGVYIAGDDIRLGFGESFYSSSNKNIVVGNMQGTGSTKYGLYDYNMNKKIDLIYNDLKAIDDDLLIAKKDGKFGVIDSSNNTIINFMYDGIESIDNYYVVIKDGKLGVLDKKGNEIIPFNYNVPEEMKFELKLCCGAENSFSVSRKGDKILISYYDSDRVLEGYRYGHSKSYIILNNDGTYVKVEHNDKIYNYSEEFYYYSNKDYDLNIYDSNRTLYKTFTCSEYMPSIVGFVNKDVLKYYCGIEEYYYNVKSYEYVNKNDIVELEKESVNFLYIYKIDDVRGVYSSNNLLLKLDNDDVFKHIYDDYFKVIKENGSVEYYRLEN